MPFLLRRVPQRDAGRWTLHLPRIGRGPTDGCYGMIIIHFAGQLVLIRNHWNDKWGFVVVQRGGSFKPFKGSHYDIWSIQFGSSQPCGRENIWNAFTWMKWILIQSFQSIASESVLYRFAWMALSGLMNGWWVFGVHTVKKRLIGEWLLLLLLLDGWTDGWVADWIQLTAWKGIGLAMICKGIRWMSIFVRASDYPQYSSFVGRVAPWRGDDNLHY